MTKGPATSVGEVGNGALESARVLLTRPICSRAQAEAFLDAHPHPPPSDDWVDRVLEAWVAVWVNTREDLLARFGPGLESDCQALDLSINLADGSDGRMAPMGYRSQFVQRNKTQDKKAREFMRELNTQLTGAPVWETVQPLLVKRLMEMDKGQISLPLESLDLALGAAMTPGHQARRDALLLEQRLPEPSPTKPGPRL